MQRPSRSRRPVRVLALLFGMVSAGVVGNCTAAGQKDLSNPVTRSLTWFSFLNGDDIRRECSAGAPDRARLVYNARYTEQVRVYELTGRGDGAALSGRVFSGTALLTVDTAEGLSAPQGQPWNTGLDATTASALWHALDTAGAFLPAPRMAVEGRGVWWLTVGCRSGRTFFHAWTSGAPRYPGDAFRQVLEPLDPTGVAFASDPGPGLSGVALRNRDEDRRMAFRLEVVPGGLLYR